jgi:hypothetical protein
MSEEQRLKVCENRVLRKISGPKREDITGEWGRTVHNEEPYDLYSSPKHYMGDQKINMGGVCGTYGGEKMNTKFWRGTMRKTDHSQDLRVHRKIILKHEWTDVAQDRDK